ncbi:hypothetical protein N8I77_008685 [Diaporthe amygdali]|uniref:Uncharacterized protein n=1 Tax=Phomopsis amygdali TaxID=1214568 RepID=A0AAD9S841_PHOAM|nr:hypothetical protein N8I77_008685 [Diaporthe amygdali]
MRRPRTAVGDCVDAVAQDTTLLSAADRDLINGFQDSLSAEAAKGRDCGGLLTAILRHLARFREQVQFQNAESEDDQQNHKPFSLSSLPNIWGPIIAEVHSIGGDRISITGPGPDDRFEVPVCSPDDASRTITFVAGIDAVCRTMRDMRDHCMLVIQKRKELGEAQKSLKQPAETTVNEHIKLLRQYNKIKDVGQQLIGLNADNRGVPVGSLYKDDHYGVGPKD